MSNLGQEAATFLTLAAARADDDEQTTGPDRSPAAEDPGPTAKKVAAALIAGSLREALGPGWTRNLYHPEAVADAESLAGTTTRILATTPLHRTAELAGITITDAGITAAQVPELAAHLTRDAVHEHIRREGVRVAAAAQDPRLVIGRGRGYIVVQHAASTLRIKFVPSISMPGLGTVDARPYDIPVIGDDDPDTWYSYVGLGIGTRLYRAAGEQLPHIRWVTSRTAGVTTAIRRRLHAEHPYRWHYEYCTWCSQNLPAGWDDSDEALFLFHPRTDPAGPAGVAGPQPIAAPAGDTAGADRPAPSANRTPRRIVPGLLMGLAGTVVLVLGLAALAGQPQGRTGAELGTPTSPAASAPTTPVAPSEAAPEATPSPLPPLPAAPPGLAATPLWGRVVAPWTKIAAGADGTVYSRTPAEQLVAFDPTTGVVTWTAPDAWGSRWDGPWTTTIDGHPAIALVGRTALAYWQLPATDTDPTTVPLPAGAVVSWAGSSPLVTRPSGAAAVVRGGALAYVSVPGGGRPLAADGSTVIGSAGRSWFRSGPGSAAQVRQTPRPRGISAAPVRVEAVGSQFLLVVWPKRGEQAITLVDAKTGQTLIQANLAKSDPDIRTGPLVRQVGGTLTSVGAVVVDTDLHTIDVLLPQYKVRALVTGHVIATDGRATSDVGLTKTGAFDILAFPQGATASPFAVITTDEGKTTLAIAPGPSGEPVLVALPPARK